MTQPIMSVEELFAFGKHQHPQSFYNNHKNFDYAKILRGHFTMTNLLTEYCNFEIPDITPKDKPYYTSVYPHHKALIQPEHTEGILCDECQDIIYIYRHIPRISNLSLSNRLSTYHPQGSKSCRCNSLSLLVSHKGIPHIYTDKTFQLVTYFNNYELRHNDFSYSELPKELNVYVKETNGNRQELVNFISLQGKMRIAEMLIAIPQSQTYGFLKLKFHNLEEHLRRYAYTYSLIILDHSNIYLPNGCIIHNHHPKVKQWFQTALPTGTKRPKFARNNHRRAMIAANSANNEYTDELNKYLCETFRLPYVPLKYYPKNTITYMQYLKPPKEFTPYYIYRLKRLRRMVSRLARRYLLTKSQQDLIQYTKDNFPALYPLKAPPPQAYYASQYFWQHPEHFPWHHEI